MKRRCAPHLRSFGVYPSFTFYRGQSVKVKANEMTQLCGCDLHCEIIDSVECHVTQRWPINNKARRRRCCVSGACYAALLMSFRPSMRQAGLQQRLLGRRIALLTTLKPASSSSYQRLMCAHQSSVYTWCWTRSLAADCLTLSRLKPVNSATTCQLVSG